MRRRGAPDYRRQSANHQGAAADASARLATSARLISGKPFPKTPVQHRLRMRASARPLARVPVSLRTVNSTPWRPDVVNTTDGRIAHAGSVPTPTDKGLEHSVAFPMSEVTGWRLSWNLAPADPRAYEMPARTEPRPSEKTRSFLCSPGRPQRRAGRSCLCRARSSAFPLGSSILHSSSDDQGCSRAACGFVSGASLQNHDLRPPGCPANWLDLHPQTWLTLACCCVSLKTG
jgi:hypothetical protein